MAILPQFKSCCYFFSLRTASLIVAWLAVVASSLICLMIAAKEVRDWRFSVYRIADLVMLSLLWLMLFIFIGYFLRGVMKRKPEHMIPFMVVWAFLIFTVLVHEVVYKIVLLIRDIVEEEVRASIPSIVRTIIAVILFVFNTYMLLVVKSYYNELVAASPRPVVQYVAAEEKQGKKGDATSSSPHEIEAKINLLQDVEYGYN